MAKVEKPKEYFASDDFELSLTSSSAEFKAKAQEGNLLPGCKVVKREFFTTEDFQGFFGIRSVAFKKGQRLTDVGQAFQLITQEATLEVRDLLQVPKGYQFMDDELAKALKAKGLPIEEKDKAQGTDNKAQA